MKRSNEPPVHNSVAVAATQRKRDILMMRKILFMKYLFPMIALLGIQNVKASNIEIMDVPTVNQNVYYVHEAKIKINKELNSFRLVLDSPNTQQHAIRGKKTVIRIKRILDDLCFKLYASIGLKLPRDFLDPRDSFEAIGIRYEDFFLDLWDVKDCLRALLKLDQYFKKIEQKSAIYWQTINVSNAKLVGKKLKEYDCAMFDRNAFALYLQHSYPTMSKSDIDKRLEYVLLIQKGKITNIVEFEYPIDYLLQAVALSVAFKTWQFLSPPDHIRVRTEEAEVKLHTDSISKYFNKALLNKDIWALRIKDSEILYGEIQLYGYLNKVWSNL